MTSLISWIGVDQRGVASMYIASDSRITWPGGSTWDHARKLFVARQYPHLLAYCGDVLFPTQTLSQIVEMIDLGMLSDIEGDADRCAKRITDVFLISLSSYPTLARARFQVLYGTRVGTGLPSQFQLRLLSSDDGLKLETRTIQMPEKSGAVEILGSGAGAVRHHLQKWGASAVGGTSRAVFSAFSDALRQGQDPHTGGPPQLTGLYRKGGAKTFGIVWQGRKYFYGTDVRGFPLTQAVQWHNELFEICDPLTRVRKSGAQPQPRPSLI